MKVFRVDRIDNISWCQDYSMVVIAEDKMTAERRARWSSEDFQKAKLKVVEIKLNKEQMVLKANTGS